MQTKILIIDDSPSCLRIASESVKNLGSIETAVNLAEARSLILQKKYDLILLDVHLPDGSGVEFCQEIASSSLQENCSVLMVTGEESITSKVTSFHLGVQDYLTKPYSPLELRARAERLLKRKVIETSYLLAFDLRLDLNLHLAQVKINENWNELSLTAKEFKILKFLLENQDQTLSRDQILDSVWGHGTFVGARVVDTHIATLRKKLGAQSVFLVNLRGLGYRWMRSDDSSHTMAA